MGLNFIILVLAGRLAHRKDEGLNGQWAAPSPPAVSTWGKVSFTLQAVLAGTWRQAMPFQQQPPDQKIPMANELL